MNFQTGKPSASALYLVDRGMQGKYYRWYDADTDQWGMCGSDMNEALANKDVSAVGEFPWVGPLTGPIFDPTKRVQEVTEESKPKAKAAKAPAKKRMAKSAGAKLVVTTVGNTKVGSIVKDKKATHPDGTVWYRADRNKWIAQWNGKQEAARDTAEACLKFLKKKYNHEGIVLPKAD